MGCRAIGRPRRPNLPAHARHPFAMDEEGTGTPAPTLQVVTDPQHGTRPAGVGMDAPARGETYNC